MAVDATSVYWSTDATVMKASVPQGTIATVLANRSGVSSIALHGGEVYLTTSDGGEVMTVSVSGGQPSMLATGQYGATSIAVSATSVYWLHHGGAADMGWGGSIMSVPVTGGTPATFASDVYSPGGVVADDAGVYWTAGQQLMEAPPGGGTATTIALGDGLGAIAVDANNVYWTQSSGLDYAVMAAPKH
jgi:hypothetical protein